MVYDIAMCNEGYHALEGRQRSQSAGCLEPADMSTIVQWLSSMLAVLNAARRS